MHSCLVSVYYTAEYFTKSGVAVPYRLIDSAINDALRIVTGCLRPTPTDNLPVLTGTQPAGLRRLGATLSLANHNTLDPDHLLFGKLDRPPDARQERLKSRRPFVPAARNLLHTVTALGIRAGAWMDFQWDAGYQDSTSKFVLSSKRSVLNH